MSTQKADLVSSARRRAVDNYLAVRYTDERRPRTTYPLQLCRYLSDTYLQGRGYEVLLDLGCGRGDFLNGFAQCGFSVTGLDNSRNPQNSYPDPVILADLDGQPLPMESESCDVVFSKSVIEHIHNTDVLLAETFRILRPGGVAIVMTPDWRSQYRHFFDDYTHVRPFTKMGLDDAVTAHGFRIVDSRHFRQLPFVWRRPWLHVYCDVLQCLPDRFKKHKTVKFSKEWMLLVVAEKTAQGGR